MTLEEALERLEKMKVLANEISNDEELDETFGFYDLVDLINWLAQSIEMEIAEKGGE